MTTSAETLDRLAGQWRGAKSWEVDIRERALREARAILQDPARRDLAWFAAAFEHRENWRFALAVVHGNLPRKLLRPMVVAGINHPDVSRNQWFIRAAVKSFSGDEVRAILDEHYAAAADKDGRDKVRAAYYWLPYAIARTASERIRKRISKLSAEERVRLFTNCDEATARELVWMLPYNVDSVRALLDEAIEFAKRQGNSYVLAVLRDKGLA